MNLRDIVPFGRHRPLAMRRADDPFAAFQRDMNRMFDELWRDFDVAPQAGNGGLVTMVAPSLDVSEDDKTIRVAAELPGVDEKDIEVTLADGRLTIRGEKKQEKEEKEKNYYLMERSYGAFERSLPIGTEIDEKAISAAFDKGVLTVTLPKTQAAQVKSRKIPIAAAKK